MGNDVVPSLLYLPPRSQPYITSTIQMPQEQLPILLNEHLADCQTILDVGCGDNSWLRFVKGKHTTGVDAHAPSIERARKSATHSEYVVGEVHELQPHFSPKSFDAVVMLDLIEHFRKEDALRLLRSAERTAVKKVIVFTPSGFLPQPPALNNPWQQHLSGWSARELVDLGYSVVGVNGWKPLRKQFASFRRPAALTSRLSSLTEPLVRNHPNQAFALFGVKDV